MITLQPLHILNYFLLVVPEPVAFYPLNEQYNVTEKVNKQSDGILGDVVLNTRPNNEIGGAYEFSGTNSSYIEFPNNGGLDTRLSITLTCWVKPGGQDGPLFHYGKSINPRGVHIWIMNGTFFNEITKYPYHTSLTAVVACADLKNLTVGEWVHVAATYNHNTGENSLYINGSLAKSQNISKGYEISTNETEVRMGAMDDDNRYFKGKISQMYVYSVALDGAQIKAVMKKGNLSTIKHFRVNCAALSLGIF